MSKLIAVLMSQLETYGNFSFFGSDGYTVNAQALNGVYRLEVLKPNGTPELNCFSDIKRIQRQVVAHV